MVNLTKKIVLYICTLHIPPVGRTLIITTAKNFFAELGIEVQEKLVNELNFVNDPNAQQLKHRIIRENAEISPDAEPSPQEKELYEYRRPPNYIPREIIVYFIQSTSPSTWGCAYRNPKRASIIITQKASSHTLAHEIGHVVGLTHVGDSNNLMCEEPKFTVKPHLTEKQKATVLASPFLLPLN
jgi:hypothetical protein